MSGSAFDGRRLVAVSAMALLVAAVAGAPAVSAATGPSLTISPNELFYPCDGVQPVQFTVAGFGDEAKVAIRYGSATGKTIGVITTTNVGQGADTVDFNTAKIPPGHYTFYAVQSKALHTSAVFTEAECP